MGDFRTLAEVIETTISDFPIESVTAFIHRDIETFVGRSNAKTIIRGSYAGCQSGGVPVLPGGFVGG